MVHLLPQAIMSATRPVVAKPRKTSRNLYPHSTPIQIQTNCPVTRIALPTILKKRRPRRQEVVLWKKQKGGVKEQAGSLCAAKIIFHFFASRYRNSQRALTIILHPPHDFSVRLFVKEFTRFQEGVGWRQRQILQARLSFPVLVANGQQPSLL